MAVSLYFGLPGCGKTTMLARLAYKAVKAGRYKYVYANVYLNIPGVTYIDNDIIGTYNLHDCLILIDEATLFADNRSYKEFSRERIQYFLMHRHYNADIVLFTQQWDGVDRKIRVITDRVYYVFKGRLLGHWISAVWRIPYGILFPDPRKTGDKLGEIVQGYCKPPIFIRLFALRFLRCRYYKYFDTYEAPLLLEVPRKYKPIPHNLGFVGTVLLLHKTSINLSRSVRFARKRKQSPVLSHARRHDRGRN